MNYTSIIESIFYASAAEGVEIITLKKILNISTENIIKIINDLKKFYESNESSGFLIKKFGNRYYLLTKEQNSEYISKTINYVPKNPIDKAMMEVLSIIAYNSPCTNSKIEKIRGVNSKNIIDKLIKLNLIVETGRENSPGRPFLYKTTQNFLNLFGIKSLSSLPAIKQNFTDTSEVDSDFFNSNRFNEDE